MPQPVYMYLFKSELLANLAPPNSPSFKVKSELKSCDHARVSNS